MQSDPAAAQRRAPPAPQNGGRGWFAIGVQQADIGDLNDALARRSLPTYSKSFLSLGGGGHAIRDRLLIGGEGHALLQADETSADGLLRTSLLGGYGLFDLGYQVVQARRLAVYPMVGIGGGALSLKILERDPPVFDDLLRNPRRGTSVSTAGLLLNAGVGANWLFPARPGRRGGFSVGVHAGWMFAPLEARWFVNGTNADVANGPDARMTGGWFRVSIGGGTR
jgi:hypothetical protein